MEDRQVVIVSNRGPVSYAEDDEGRLVARRGSGGIASGLAPLAETTRLTWIATALSDADRRAAAQGAAEIGGMQVRLLPIDERQLRMAYNVICNATLWFLHHGLYDLSRRPVIDRHWHEAWDAYRSMNETFADAVIEHAPEGSAVLVQDYHLCLLGPMLTERRPDLATVHFTHTPFAGPDAIRVLPPAEREELLTGLGAFGSLGFHSRRWADTYQASSIAILGAAAPTFVTPLASDRDALARNSRTPECERSLAELSDTVGERRFLVRSDRIELSKNLLRGFAAFDVFLDERPEWRDRVVFGAFCYPSREGLPEYLAYRQQIEQAVAQVNERWGTDSWTPILLDTNDDYPRSLAALRRADALLVNPIRDGLNLVAKEAALLNERDAPLLLSPEAGVWDELGEAAIPVQPFDVSQTAAAIHEGLTLEGPLREERAARLRAIAGARTPADWLADLLAAAE